MRCLVFVHVPRTGGSSVWHNLVDVATRSGVGICDIYHESKLQHGLPIHTKQVLADCRARLGAISCLYHHHTADPVLNDFGDDAVFATVLRDPVDRFISFVYFMRSYLSSATLDSDTKAYYRQQYGREFTVGVESNLSAQRLMDIAVTQEQFRNYYTNYFGSLFNIDRSRAGGFFSRRWPASSDLRSLAQSVRSKFAVVGSFDNIDICYGEIVETFGIGSRTECMTRVVNKGESRPELSATDRRRYERNFQLDYQFIEHLRSLSINTRDQAGAA